jgi:glycosyltransferase involved in cell wall biosynthesis
VPYIEAMACGLPVVASPNVGAVEVTENGRIGLVPQDEELAQTIINVLTDSALRQKLSDLGLARAKDFSWETVAAKYEELYSGGRMGG